MIRASPVIVFFSVVLATIYPVACTWAGGGSTLSQGRHSPAKRHFYSGYQCPDCSKELINPVFICRSHHVLCERCASRCRKRHHYCCSLCGKALLESFTVLTAEDVRYLQPLNRKQSQPRHSSSRSPRHRSSQHNHTNIRTLSDRANQLSRNQRDVNQLARLARNLPGARELGNATAIDLALLVNSISKLIPYASHKQTAENCLSQLSREIARRDLKEWREQSLAMAADGLGKAEGKEITEALKKIAKVVRQGEKLWTERHLAMLVSGLSKDGGDATTKALKVIAQEVILKGPERWEVQQLAMLAIGLSKAGGREITKALKKIAKIVRQGQKVWTERDLAMLATGLSRAEGREIIRALKKIAQAANRMGVKGWTERHLAMLAIGLSKAEGREITKALKKIAQEVNRAGVEGWTERQLAMLACGLSKAEGNKITEGLKKIAQVVRRGKKYWTERDLAMLANGLSKAEGEEITDALKAVAQKVNRTGVEGWKEQHLAMLAGGLSKAEGREITAALKEIAREANRVGVKGWTEQHLTVLATGLGRAEGKEITDALREVAQEADRVAVKGWTEQHLAMLASGVSKAEGWKITEVLKTIAKVIRRGEKVWTVQQLAMLVRGLNNVEGEEITGALQEIAQQVAQRGVKGWTEQDLAMMISGLAPIASHPAFSICVKELISRQNSRWLLLALGYLCRLQLSQEQAQACLDIVVALNKQDFKPEDRHQGKDILWCLALLHFVFDTHEDEVSRAACQQLRGLYQKFAGYSGDYPASSGSLDQKPIGDSWQEHYARDYWKEGKSLPVPTVTYPINEPSISRAQKIISEAISRSCLFETEIARAKVREEVGINGFPVDIMVGEKVCVEIDGPYHYVYSDQPGLYDSAVGTEKPLVALPVQKYQRAKDHFMVHMLEKYGYPVFRIPYDISTDSRQFQRVIHNIQKSLNQAD